jgi:hypothetical protein
MLPDTISGRDLLRHCLATIAYRGSKTVRDVPDSFANFQAGENARTPVQIVAHVGDLFDWGLSMAKGQPAWHDSQPLPWADEVKRFFASLKLFDEYLAGDETLHVSPEKLFQGPASDALNHIGQIAMLRRLAGFPIKGENYFKADIVAGQVGPEQPAPRREFK